MPACCLLRPDPAPPILQHVLIMDRHAISRDYHIPYPASYYGIIPFLSLSLSLCVCLALSQIHDPQDLLSVPVHGDLCFLRCCCFGVSFAFFFKVALLPYLIFFLPPLMLSFFFLSFFLYFAMLACPCCIPLESSLLLCCCDYRISLWLLLSTYITTSAPWVTTPWGFPGVLCYVAAVWNSPADRTSFLPSRRIWQRSTVSRVHPAHGANAWTRHLPICDAPTRSGCQQQSSS